MSPALASVAIVAGVLSPAAAVGHPTNHIGEALAEIMVRNGCEMDGDSIVREMQTLGLGAGDYQAQVTALYRGGHLVSGAREGQLQLVNWGVCS